MAAFGLALLAVIGVLLGTDGGGPGRGPAPAVLLAAGDIAECGFAGDEATAEILERFPEATIAAVGDTVYDKGTPDEYERCYKPSWGRFRSRTRPAVGNHEYSTEDASGFADYFGDLAGRAGAHWYSYDIGPWHAVVLNSQCWKVGGCEQDDPQLTWLRRDLDENAERCTVAYFHRPPFSSGRYGDLEATDNLLPLWQALVDGGVDVALAGHEHSYERMQPLDRDGKADPDGARLFIVGTGGGNLRQFRTPPLPITEARDGGTWGVLKLDLEREGYSWAFLPVAGGDFEDAGTGRCQ